MKRFVLISLSVMCLQFSSAVAQTPVLMRDQPGLSYTENFNDIEFWTSPTSRSTGSNHFASVATNGPGTIPNGVRTTFLSSAFSGSTTSGGVQSDFFSGNPTGAIVLLSTGSTDNNTAVALDFLMDFSGVNAGTMSFNWAAVNNSTGNRNASFRVYWSVDGTTFTELIGAQVLNFANNTLPLPSGSITNLALPVEFTNSPTARLRLYNYNGVGGTIGSRPKISIDNLNITAAPIGPSAARVSLGGRVLTVSGRGIRNAAVTIEGGELIEPKRSVTGSFGFYNFEGLESGQTYVVTIRAKRYVFQTPSFTINLDDDLANADFVANP